MLTVEVRGGLIHVRAEGRLDPADYGRFGRVAIVGDKTWEKWGAELSAPFFPGTKVRYLDRSEGKAAEEWARGRG